MFICSCSKAGCPHVLLHGAGEREDSVALHGWDFIKKPLWCVISTLLNSSDTSFHKGLLGCQVRLTWRSCNSITATRLVRHAGIVLLYRQPEHEWTEFIHVPSLDFISSHVLEEKSSWDFSVVLLQEPNTDSSAPRLRDGRASFSGMKQQEQFGNYIMTYKETIVLRRIMAVWEQRGFAADSPGLRACFRALWVQLWCCWISRRWRAAEVASGRSYCITGFSREKVTGWIDVAERVVGWWGNC